MQTPCRRETCLQESREKATRDGFSRLLRAKSIGHLDLIQIRRIGGDEELVVFVNEIMSGKY